ncbi:MAG TPA: preprotein translocase subunit SecG [Bryobacteraceae bacterium]|nr:preprotein translocase subunit SecG [Bryobacteraceae bacterium]
MYILVLIVHIVVCIFLTIVVLLQSGQAADLAGAFGGMGSQTAFGPRGSATLLSKATTVSAIIFMVTSMTLSIMATKNAGLGATVLEGGPKPVPAKSVPATPSKTNVQIPGAPAQQGSGNVGNVPVAPPPAPANQPAKK